MIKVNSLSFPKQLEQLERKLGAIRKNAIPNAMARSINLASTRAKTATVRVVASQEKVAQKPIRNRIHVTRKASKDSLMVRTHILTNDMLVSSIGKPRQTKRGVTVRGRRYQGAFVADGSKGYGRYMKGSRYQSTSLKKTMVFERVGKARYPLKAVKIPIATPLRKSYSDALQQAYSTVYPKELVRQIELAVNRLGRK